MLWSLTYNTYETISICSLGSLVICGVGGSAVFLGISQSGGATTHSQDFDTFNLLETSTWSGLTWLTIIAIGFLTSTVLLAWSCWGKQLATPAGENNYRVQS